MCKKVISVCLSALLGTSICTGFFVIPSTNNVFKDEIVLRKEENSTKQVIRTFKIIDLETPKIEVEKKTYMLNIYSEDITVITRNMYNFIQSESDILPQSMIKKATLDNNGILHVEFDKHFLQNFKGDEITEKVLVKIVNYNFMEIENVKGIVYSFEKSPNCVTLHGDYSKIYTETIDEGFFKIL